MPINQRISAPSGPRLAAAIPGLIVPGLLLLWAVQDGGYDPSTWYWGGLVLLALLAITAILLGARRTAPNRPALIAIALLCGYVAWSYLSITWAASPGDALQGSNRALTYLLLFALMLTLPWTERGATAAMIEFAIGIGTIAIVLVFRLTLDDGVGKLIVAHRLSGPTGYFNATGALFTIGALVAVGLAARRTLPGLLRGLLLALACADLELATVVQSRGWLFTLPVLTVVVLAVGSDRLRLAAAGALPVAGTLVPVHRLLAVGQVHVGTALEHASVQAGEASLMSAGAVLVFGTLLAWGDGLRGERRLPSHWRRRLGAALVALVLIAVAAGGMAATHGHPFRYVSHQISGFSHEPSQASVQSHFSVVGSGRYDFWRVALDAVASHPIGGLGQDNFDSYYLRRGHTTEEPAWTHSLEMRLLAHTGLVGFMLFAGFIVFALIAVLSRRGRPDPGRRALATVALLPLADWLVHGSVDWFWEMPALAGPALGFLGMALSLAARRDGVDDGEPADHTAAVPHTHPPARGMRPASAAAASVLALAAAAVLGLCFLSVRHLSLAERDRARNPVAALNRLSQAARLNPLSSSPGRIAGALAMEIGRPDVARARFGQSIAREPQGWFSWLGAGLAASALGTPSVALHDFRVAARLNRDQPAIRAAEARALTTHPLTYAQMLPMLVLAG